MFKPGEFEAARLFVACLGQHANGHTFKTDSIGFEFFDIAELPAAVSDDGTIVTTKDFIRAALQIVYGQLQTLELITDGTIHELISDLGVTIAAENPQDA